MAIIDCGRWVLRIGLVLRIGWVLRIGLVLLMCLVLVPSSSLAQESTWRFGIGGLVGRTSGFSVKLISLPEDSTSGYIRAKSLELGMTSDLDDYFEGALHVTIEEPIPDSPLHVLMGPGLLFGIRDKQPFFGLSALVGVHFPRDQFEVFLQLTPGLQLYPHADGEVGASAGMRYFF